MGTQTQQWSYCTLNKENDSINNTNKHDLLIGTRKYNKGTYNDLDKEVK